MLNLHHFESLCSRLTIPHRDIATGTRGQSRWRFNPSQQKIMAKLYERRYQKKPLWLIFLKARRLGISTFTAAMLVAQQLQKPGAKGMIVAQLSATSKELFERAQDFSKQLPIRLPPHTQQEIYFPHSNAISTLRRSTAKTVISGRGLTLNGLHLTEAAFYPGEDSFVALLNTVSAADPDNIVVIETTANGIEGDGEAYYNYWEAAVRGDNGFMPIFLPWWDDPVTFLPDDLAPDAGEDDYEKWLMKDFGVTKGQIAWFRTTLETKCGGSLPRWRAEYPAEPMEAFVSSGNPAFEVSEMALAKKTVCRPIAIMSLTVIKGKPLFEESRAATGPPLKVFEWPVAGAHYYLGVDAAKGVEDGDFAAIVGWNAETGGQAFTYAAKVGPELLSAIVNHLGRWYNNAMVNVEITGGWGYMVIKDLRDRWHYPTQYMWMSRDDRPDKKGRQALGWETTDRSRQRIMTLFRTALRRDEIIVKDIEVVQQMDKCKMELGWRWTVIRGHDDVLMAAFLGWVAKEDHHFPHGDSKRKAQTMKTEEDMAAQRAETSLSWMDSPESTAFGLLGWTSSTHTKMIKNYEKQKRRLSTLGEMQ